jgi:glycosyltransferase involved in cell wall biosynthesis
VLFIHDFYQQYGGEDAVVEAEFAGLRAAGVETLLYSRRNEEIREFSLRRLAASGLAAIQSSQTRRELGQVIEEFRPDVAYLHNLYPLISPSAYDTLWARRVPIVQVMHNFRPFCVNGLFYSRGELCTRCADGNYWHAIVRKCLPRGRTVTAVYAAALWRMRNTGALDKIDTFLCLNSFTSEKLVEAGLSAARVAVKPNSIDLTGIVPEFETGDYALFLGRLSAEKGLRTLAAAAELVPSIPVVIAGTGPMERELQRTARRIPNLRLAGFQSGAAKRRLLEEARFLVLCSEWYEGFPVVLLEAFAAGKPVIGSALGSLPRLIDAGKTGLLYEAGSPRDLAGRMELLWNNPDLRRRMGEAARACVEERYDRSRALASLIQIFERVIARHDLPPAPAGVSGGGGAERGEQG